MQSELTNMSTSQIESLTNIELQKIFMALRSQIITRQRDSTDTKDLEITFCYVTREIQMRN